MLFLVIFAVWGVFLYNQLVDFRHEIANTEKIFRQKEVENAELKNSLYSIIDRNNLESMVGNGVLVLDKNPEYLKTANVEGILSGF